MRKILYFVLPLVISLTGCELDLGNMSLAPIGDPYYPPYPSPTTRGPYFQSVYFTSPMTGWATALTGRIAYTSDGGSSWTVERLGYNDFRCVAFVTSTNGWMVATQSNELHFTADAGQNWEALDLSETEISLWDITFSSDNVGWAVGYESGEGATIAHTTDAGGTWTIRHLGIDQGLLAVEFVGEKAGWAVGYNGMVCRTTDSGDNWTIGSCGVNQTLNDVDFVMPNRGWIVGAQGTILSTTDGGDTWSDQAIEFAPHQEFKSVDFVNERDGWLVSTSGWILHTRDGGDNWTVQDSTTRKSLSDVFFLDVLNGWAVGYDGTVLRTSDGGYRWRMTRVLEE